MLRLSAVVFICAVTAQFPAMAHPQEDVAACTPDAMRLCQQAIPDESRVIVCLNQNKLQLSPACAVVFNRPRPASASRERPASVQATKILN